MALIENRAAGTGIPGRGTNYEGSNNSTNVIPLPTKIKLAGSPFDQLTAQTVIAQHRTGTLPEGVIVALLAGVGLHL